MQSDEPTTLENKGPEGPEKLPAERRKVQSSRRFLTGAEMTALIKATAGGRYPARDRAMCMLMFYHGLRVTELCRTALADLDMEAGRLWVNRLKGSLSTSHPLQGGMIRALRRWLDARPSSPYKQVFLSERGDPFSRFGVHHLVRTWGERAGFAFGVHPHMLRHACGYALVNMEGGSKDARLIQDYLGHRDPRHTAEYTALAAGRFDELWGDP